MEKRDPVGVPLPTSDQKYGLQPRIRCAHTPPRFFSRVKLQSVRRVLRDRFQQGATPLCFSTLNSTYVLAKNQEVFRDVVRSYRHLFARPAVKFQFIAEHSQQYSITLLCQALEVSESGYYAWCQREVSEHQREDARLEAQIQQIDLSHRQVYGSPRCAVLPQARGAADAAVGLVGWPQEIAQADAASVILVLDSRPIVSIASLRQQNPIANG